MNGTSSPRYPQIQWLRGIAAFLVVFEHLKNEMTFRLQGVQPSQSELAVFPFAVGVDIFFVISGFVIAHSSAALFGQREAWRTFAIRRLARIVPLYWLVTLLFAALLVASGSGLADGMTPSFVLSSLFFIPAVNIQGETLPLMPLGWTLNYEMMFYAVFGLCLALPRRAALPAVAAILLAVVVAGQMLRPPQAVLRFWSDPIILEFLAGIAIHTAVAAGLTLSSAVRFLLAAGSMAFLWRFGLPLDDYSRRALLWGAPAALIVLAATAARREGGKVGWADLVGDVSYAIYLSHLFVLLALSRLFLSIGATGPFAVYILYPGVALPLIVLGSLALHRAFERPTLAFLRQRFDRNLTRGPGAPPGP